MAGRNNGKSGGTITKPVIGKKAAKPSLTDEVVLRLGKLAFEIEKFCKSSANIEWGIFEDEIYIFQLRPISNVAPETDYELNHEFDESLRCENEYFTIADIGEVMPGAISPLGIDIIKKYSSAVIKVHQGNCDAFKTETYTSPNHSSFMNHMMLKVMEMIAPAGIESHDSKSLMISIFGRILDDPELISYAKERFKTQRRKPVMEFLKTYVKRVSETLSAKNVKEKIDNYHLNFMKINTPKESFTALTKSLSSPDFIEVSN
ncbi:putative phosphoenolpyruvate synthase [Nephila pilipes]|uniref:Putative phosphoenolpyruvate synthase n=1 Tax=Nephila pilipes TaxID=299642 RepID=A0A8X6TYM6_NEPPI|nr:putative phosphoenolpyruvate synthase [Nephila pilipes]